MNEPGKKTMGLSKIRRKSSHWHKHGKHRSVLMEIRALRRRVKRRPEPMYASIREALDAAAADSHRRHQRR